MKSGMLAAEATYNALKDDTVKSGNISSYQTVCVSRLSNVLGVVSMSLVGLQAIENSWVWQEMKSVRNYHPSFKYGLIPGVVYSGLSGFLLKGREPWTFHHSGTDSSKVFCILSPHSSLQLHECECRRYFVVVPSDAPRCGVSTHRVPQT